VRPASKYARVKKSRTSTIANIGTCIQRDRASDWTASSAFSNINWKIAIVVAHAASAENARRARARGGLRAAAKWMAPVASHAPAIMDHTAGITNPVIGSGKARIMDWVRRE
jgi:hypothetical protein